MYNIRLKYPEPYWVYHPVIDAQLAAQERIRSGRNPQGLEKLLKQTCFQQPVKKSQLPAFLGAALPFCASLPLVAEVSS